MKLAMGTVELELGGPYLGYLRDANALLDDVEGLRRRMGEDGYLLIRGLHDRETVIRGRQVLLEALRQDGHLAPDTSLDDAVIPEGARGAFWGGRRSITHTPEVLAVLEGKPVMTFFERFLGGPVMTYDYKWLRVVSVPEFTGAHYDIVYMGRGTPNLYTCWTPFGDVELENSPLAVCVGSHRFERIKETYGRMDVDRDRVQGWFSNDPREVVDAFGGQWQTASFRMGDALIFGMFTMHGSFNNRTNRYRISADTRYQLAAEPVDERWIGEQPLAHYAWNAEPEKNVSMEEARARWGV